MQHDPRYTDVRREVLEFFEREMSRMVRAGLPENRIVLDPGIGFGKTLEHNLALLATRKTCLRSGGRVHGLVHEILFWRASGPARRRSVVWQQPRLRQCCAARACSGTGCMMLSRPVRP